MLPLHRTTVLPRQVDPVCAPCLIGVAILIAEGNLGWAGLARRPAHKAVIIAVDAGCSEEAFSRSNGPAPSQVSAVKFPVSNP